MDAKKFALSMSASVNSELGHIRVDMYTKYIRIFSLNINTFNTLKLILLTFFPIENLINFKLI